jgi:hypothetical protein
MEWVDNSFQHGLSDRITIMIDSNRNIAIRDYGIGIDDINRVFRLGDASAYGDWSQIGQYGVGATDAMIYLGEVADVETVRDGRKHRMVVDWDRVERTGLWPLRYAGAGVPASKGEVGTRITVRRLNQHYKLTTSEAVAKELGLTFAPALRAGAKITLYHYVWRERRVIEVEAFVPPDLTDVKVITGSVVDGKTEYRWTGYVGLSRSLVERHNGVHISFRHRVIEMTRDPFMGLSASTLYAEVALDETTPWKYQLSDHKDKVIGLRKELINNIHQAIKPLLEKSREQSTNLALLEMTAPIEQAINQVLKGAVGDAFCGDEEVLGGLVAGEEEGGIPPDPDKEMRDPALRIPKDVGEPGKKVKVLTGIKVEYVEREKLQGRAFTWDVQNKLFVIKLEKEGFSEVVGWPPRLREKHVRHLVISLLSHAVEMMFWRSELETLRPALSKNLFNKIENEWAPEPKGIAPYFYSYIMTGLETRSV